MAETIKRLLFVVLIILITALFFTVVERAVKAAVAYATAMPLPTNPQKSLPHWLHIWILHPETNQWTHGTKWPISGWHPRLYQNFVMCEVRRKYTVESAPDFRATCSPNKEPADAPPHR